MKYILTILLLMSFQGYAKVNLNVVSREAASIFEIMDNTSNWWEGFCDIEYRQYWEKKYKISKEDEKYFKQYQNLRDKYYSDPDQREKNPLKNRNGLFSTIGSLSPDPYAEAFYSSDSLEEAYKKLENLLSKAELKFVQKFYEYFKEKYKPLVAETKGRYKIVIQNTSKSLIQDKITTYIHKIARFYDVNKKLDYEIIFVWWPPISSTRANPTGKFLVMKNNPKKHGTGDGSDIAMHELIHSISKLQQLESKKRLTKKFYSKCSFDYKKYKKYYILEEPLAVILGQMYYQEMFQPKRFKFEAKWYNNKLIDSLSKLYYPVVKKHFVEGKVIDSSLIEKLGKNCAESKLLN